MASKSFADQVQMFAVEVPSACAQVVQKAAIDIMGRLVERTPVGNPSLWKGRAPAGYVGGRLRGNWNVGLGSIDSSERPVDKDGSSTKRRNEAEIGNAQKEQPIYITNSLPYAIPVEYGYSTQAPAGMVRVTVTEWNGLIDKAAKEANK